MHEFHYPAKALGFGFVTDYKRDQLGIQEGGQHGSLFIDGDHFCPGIPQGLIDATKRAEAGVVTEQTFRNLMDRRALYLLKNRSAPAADGTVKKRCPAYGPQATITCPLRETPADPTAAPKPRVLKRDLPEGTPKICCQSSVTFKETDQTVKFAQLYRYGSEKWATVYEYDRNTSEGVHGYFKDAAHENVAAPKRRRAYGLAAQQVLVTMLIVAANLRKLSSFIAEQKASHYSTAQKKRPTGKPVLRRREREGLSNYKRHWGRSADELPFEQLVETEFVLKPKPPKKPQPA